MSASVSLRHVNKVYAQRAKNPIYAVKDFNIEIKPGEIVALLGSSGCGKTSTLRMIAGFEEVTEGEILIGDRPVHRLAPAKRNVAMAFEGYSLYPPLTLRQNIAFALKGERLDTAEVSRRVDAISKLLELDKHLDRYPSSVSAGQQQRASLGRALVRKADIYLLDEPMGQLEPQLRAALRGRLKRYLREHRMTAILVTHDQTEANALADRIAVMEGGRLQQFASPGELKDAPANLFVGTFIGEPPMNVYRVRPSLGEGRVSFRGAGDGKAEVLSYAESEFSAPIRQLIGKGEEIVLGIRPHDVRVGEGASLGEIVSNQWIGDQTHMEAAFPGGVIVSTLDARHPGRMGEPVKLAIPAGKLHIFAGDGRAIAHGTRLV
ncbi:ABC transporter ATP-binding protein [Aureimonas endophytica]|uniref:ABC transporter ATP-binding protein n=1 Tax=Aureimonas endophytica TaxID=2027858 RepID=A0A916ZC47_9HYPH|nr:ABC transporter ATP-binding protein [Aureimonas endophytica]GGD86957.1 ABC transporter ATP-binding protein [Aureimonas endophytica]